MSNSVEDDNMRMNKGPKAYNLMEKATNNCESTACIEIYRNLGTDT